MTKIKASVFALGAIILVLVSIVGTYFTLLATGSISTDGVRLEITLKDAEKEYDGEALFASEYEITSGTLLKGDVIEVKYTGSQTDVGYSKSGADVSVFNKDNYNVTKNYNIKVNPGSLTVRKRNITVKASDEKITYTGGIYTGKNYDIVTGSIVAGEKAIPTFKTVDINEETNQGVSELELLVYDSLGMDVTKNYNIIYQSGTVTLDKIALNIRTLSYSKEFDGTPMDEANFKYELVNSSLPNNYKLEVDFEDKNVTYTSENSILTIKDTKIYNENNEDITKYFVVTPINTGLLTITPHSIDVILDESNNTKEYDGNKFSNTKYTIKNEEDNEKFTYNDNVYTLKLVDYTEIENAGSVQNNLTFVVQNIYGDDVTSNFDIRQTSSILTITKKNLIVYGESKTISSTEIDDLEDILIDTRGEDGLKVDDSDMITGLLEGQCAYLDYTLPKIEDNKTKYSLAFTVIVKTRQDKDGEDITNNYNITSIYGNLFIKDVYSLNISSYQKEYDGNNLTYDSKMNISLTDTDGNPVSLDLIINNIYFQSIEGSSIKDVGEYQVIAKLINDDVDYSIDSEAFECEITKRSVSINGETFEAEYTGDQIEFKPASSYSDNKTNDIAVCTNLAFGQYVKFEYEEKYEIDASEYEVKVTDVRIVDSSNFDVTSNYTITNKPDIKGKLLINKKVLNLQIFNQSFTYDGINHTNDIKKDFDGTLDLKYKEINSTDEIKLLDAGEYIVTAELNSSDKGNYDLKVICGTIVINKKKITAIGKLIQKVYDGKEHKKSDFQVDELFEFSEGVAAADLDLELIKFTAKNAGLYNIGIENNSKNYELEVTAAVLEIQKRTVLITTSTVTGTSAIIPGDYEVSDEVFTSEFGIEVSYLDHVGSITNSITAISAKGNYSLSNYNLIISEGTLTKTA